MRKSAALIAILLISNGPLSAEEFTGNFSGFIGNKSLDKNEWQNTDSQGTFGIITDIKKKSWPVSIAVDAFLSIGKDDNQPLDTTDNTPDFDASTGALHLGVRKIWNIEGSSFSPYFGGGIAYNSGSQERIIDETKEDQSDTAMGSWIGTGVYWRPSKHLNIGFDLRYSQADINLFAKEVDAGGLQSGLFIGYHW
jgi:opacity protein-like surface antigen